MEFYFKDPLPVLIRFLATQSPLKVMESAFHFMLLKALFVLKIPKFCPDFFGNVRKRLDKKAKKVNIKTYNVIANTNTTEITSNTTEILPNISRCKGHRTIKFAQLTEYSMRNLSLE